MRRGVTPVSKLRVYMTVTAMGKCEFKKFLPVFISSSFYQKIQQTELCWCFN